MLKDVTNLVKFAGFDDWDRALFRTKSGLLTVDVDGELHSRTPDWGEPDYPLGVATPKPPYTLDKDDAVTIKEWAGQ